MNSTMIDYFYGKKYTKMVTTKHKLKLNKRCTMYKLNLNNYDNSGARKRERLFYIT